MLNPKAYSAQLIRDLCNCRECRHPGNGQRLRSITQLSTDLKIERIENGWYAYAFHFNDGHEVIVTPDSLRAIEEQEPIDADWRSEGSKWLWKAKEAPSRLFNWNQLQANPDFLADALEQLLLAGFFVVTAVPTHDRAVLDVIASFGYPRVTNYGDIFEVRVEENPNNLAFTNVAIPPHTDNPYRDPVPTIQLLLCLQSEVAGGESGLVDGFLAAATLRQENPKAFELLTKTNIEFRFEDAATSLRAFKPVIGLNAAGLITEVRWNDRSMQPLIGVANPDEVYASLREFAEILNDPANQVNFKLNPGDCMVFDNTRTLHARTAFDSAGKRHLQGAYADLDSAISKLEVLRRETSLESDYDLPSDDNEESW